jgi:hypothetical protein
LLQLIEKVPEMIQNSEADRMQVKILVLRAINIEKRFDEVLKALKVLQA